MLKHIFFVGTVLVVGTGFTHSAHAITLTSEECISAYVELKSEPNHKAFAVSADGDACGFASNYGSQSQARWNAIKNCNDVAEDGSCVIVGLRNQSPE